MDRPRYGSSCRNRLAMLPKTEHWCGLEWTYRQSSSVNPVRWCRQRQNDGEYNRQSSALNTRSHFRPSSSLSFFDLFVFLHQQLLCSPATSFTQFLKKSARNCVFVLICNFACYDVLFCTWLRIVFFAAGLKALALLYDHLYYRVAPIYF